MSNDHWTDICGVFHSKDPSSGKDGPTGHGWTFEEADRDLRRKEQEEDDDDDDD